MRRTALNCDQKGRAGEIPLPIADRCSLPIVSAFVYYDDFVSPATRARVRPIISLMKSSLWRIVLLCLCSPICGTAKRLPPKPVPPVVAHGVRYSAEGDGKDSYVVASDGASGRKLWRVKVFHTRIKIWRGEEDNQWVFISDLKLAGSSLLVRDENNRCYSISLKTKRVKKMACGNTFPSQEPPP